jgi:hypothetical protein
VTFFSFQLLELRSLPVGLAAKSSAREDSEEYFDTRWTLPGVAENFSWPNFSGGSVKAGL